jgi:hypothetical protein
MTAAHIAKLRGDIAALNLSIENYARTVLLRDPRTVFRWLSGQSPIPKPVQEYLDQKGSET